MDFFAVVHIFVARYSGGEVKIQEDEISEFKWVTIEEALNENLAFSYKKILERIRDEFGDILKK
jgi:NADH pyrophosphatase NudC (nudix superfamily)